MQQKLRQHKKHGHHHRFLVVFLSDQKPADFTKLAQSKQTHAQPIRAPGGVAQMAKVNHHVNVAKLAMPPVSAILQAAEGAKPGAEPTPAGG